MKKMVCLVLALITVALIALPAISFAQADGEYLYVKTGNGKTLNVRSEPKMGNNIMGTIAYGKKVRVYQYANGGKWALVEPTDWSMSNPGWVMTSYLVKDKPGKYQKKTVKEDPKTAEKSVTDIYSTMIHVDPYEATVKPAKTGDFVNVRWAPSKSAAVMTLLYGGSEVTVLCEGEGWNQVQDINTGYVGFVDASFLVRIDE